jgi:hypothetical protein
MAVNVKITVCSDVPHRAMHAEIETRPLLINTCVRFQIIRFIFVIEFMDNFVHPITFLPVPVAARSKAWICGSSIAGTAGSNLSGHIDVCLL